MILAVKCPQLHQRQNLQNNALDAQILVFVCLAIYESLSQYPMKSDPRGRCLIINMSHFDKGDVPLNPRAGADKDIGQFCMFSASRF